MSASSHQPHSNHSSASGSPISLDPVIEYLESEGWPFEEVAGEPEPVLRTGFQGRNGTWLCYCHARPTHKQLLFYSSLTERAPESSRMAVAEFLTRANWGLMIGNFELDLRDGQVRFKTSIQLEETPLAVDMVRMLVLNNVVVMDRYLPGLQTVMLGDATPEAAIAAVEAAG